MSAIGFAITKLTSRFGLISQKAAKRLATETGKKMVDRENALRGLKKDDIERVFAQTLPKKCRPKVEEDLQEIINIIANNMGEKRAIRAATELKSNSAAAYIHCIGEKGPIWLPLSRIAQTSNLCVSSITAHELLHALEGNNTLKGIFERNILTLFRLLKDVYRSVKQIKSNPVKELEESIRSTTNTIVLRELMPTAFAKKILNGECEDSIRKGIRAIINPKSSITKNSDYTHGKQKLKKEFNACSVGGATERYAQKTVPEEYTLQEALALLYKEAIRILNEEQKLFLKNKSNGKLKDI